MKKIIEWYYDKIFADKESNEEVPYLNKLWIFIISVILGSVTLILITLDIIKNIKSTGTN